LVHGTFARRITTAMCWRASPDEPTCGPCGGERSLTTRTHHRPCPTVTMRTTPSSPEHRDDLTEQQEAPGPMFEAGR